MSNLQKILPTLRRDYAGLELDEKSVMRSPLQQFGFWMEQVLEAEVMDANAMTLATTDSKGKPNLRIVLLKGFDRNGFTFFTNYKSHKGEELASNKNACLNFFWPEVHRQVRISGKVSKAGREESDEYFASRPRESQIGAWASMQSSIIKDRKTLELNFASYSEKFKGKQVPRPPYWGGYILKPAELEFWQGRTNRLHDRILYRKGKDGRWKISRLSP